MANLIDQGLLSRAAAQLCSRGVAQNSTETLAKLETLFPKGQLPLARSFDEAPAFEIQPEAVKKTIMSWPKGLAAGCSGLRAEHVNAVLLDRNAGNAAQALEIITKFTNLCIAGYLPHELQEFFCGGRLILLNKKDQGLPCRCWRVFPQPGLEARLEGSARTTSGATTDANRRQRQRASDSGGNIVREVVVARNASGRTLAEGRHI